MHSSNGSFCIVVLSFFLASCSSLNSVHSENPIAYLGLVEGHWQVWLTDGQGQVHLQLTSDPVDKSRISWGSNPDNLYLNTSEGKFYKYVIASGKQTEISIPDHLAMDVAISPSEQKAAFSAKSLGANGIYELWMIEIETGKARKLTHSKKSNISVLPSWSFDSQILVYVKSDGITHELWQITPNPYQNEQLTVSNGKEFDPAFGPVSGTVAYSGNNKGNYDIWIKPKNKPARQITTNSAFDASPSWSSDESEIVFYSARDGLRRLWIKNLLDNSIRSITDGSIPSRQPIWFSYPREALSP